MDEIWIAEESEDSQELDQTAAQADGALRPKLLQDFVGQERIRSNLKVYVQASNERNEALDHVLFYGPPGLGKTTLAHIMGAELGVPVQTASGPALDKPKDLAAILSRLEGRGVLFIDEIHRMPTAVEEILYPAMEDFELDIMVGEGPTARSLKIQLPPFTLVGATTRASLLSKPLRDRFGIKEKLEFYNVSELASIVEQNGKAMDLELAPEVCAMLAKRGRGTPRIAIQLLRRVRDFMQVRGLDGKTAEPFEELLDSIGVDREGLLPGDREYLELLAHKYKGGPTGLTTLSAALGENKDTLESYVEPYLIRKGFIDRTPKGRALTHLAYEHLGIPAPTDLGAQSSLFTATEPGASTQ